MKAARYGITFCECEHLKICCWNKWCKIAKLDSREYVRVAKMLKLIPVNIYAFNHYFCSFLYVNYSYRWKWMKSHCCKFPKKVAHKGKTFAFFYLSIFHNGNRQGKHYCCHEIGSLIHLDWHICISPWAINGKDDKWGHAHFNWISCTVAMITIVIK